MKSLSYWNIRLKRISNQLFILRILDRFTKRIVDKTTLKILFYFMNEKKLEIFKQTVQKIMKKVEQFCAKKDSLNNNLQTILETIQDIYAETDLIQSKIYDVIVKNGYVVSMEEYFKINGQDRYDRLQQRSNSSRRSTQTSRINKGRNRNERNSLLPNQQLFETENLKAKNNVLIPQDVRSSFSDTAKSHNLSSKTKKKAKKLSNDLLNFLGKIATSQFFQSGQENQKLSKNSLQIIHEDVPDKKNHSKLQKNMIQNLLSYIKKIEQQSSGNKSFIDFIDNCKQQTAKIMENNTSNKSIIIIRKTPKTMSYNNNFRSSFRQMMGQKLFNAENLDVDIFDMNTQTKVQNKIRFHRENSGFQEKLVMSSKRKRQLSMINLLEHVVQGPGIHDLKKKTFLFQANQKAMEINSSINSSSFQDQKDSDSIFNNKALTKVMKEQQYTISAPIQTKQFEQNKGQYRSKINKSSNNCLSSRRFVKSRKNSQLNKQLQILAQLNNMPKIMSERSQFKPNMFLLAQKINRFGKNALNSQNLKKINASKTKCLSTQRKYEDDRQLPSRQIKYQSKQNKKPNNIFQSYANITKKHQIYDTIRRRFL